MRPRILWLDCLGGLIVGTAAIAISKHLSIWEGLPLSTVVFMGVGNLVYGLFSLFVTTRSIRPMMLVKILAIANMLWLIVCLAIIAIWWGRVTGLGLLHVLGEGFYVASLGYAEWRMRETLATS